MTSTQPVRARRRDKPVSVSEIAETALALLDEVGMEGLTMRRLASAMGVEPMTLYRYLPNKEAVLAAVADLLWQELRPFVSQTDGWAPTVRAMWLDMYQLMTAHPHAVPMIARAGSYSHTATEGTARMLEVLKSAGFPPQLATEFLHATSALVVGFAYAHLWSQMENQGRRPLEPAGEIRPLTPETLAYAQSIGPWEAGQFVTALDLLIAGFAARLTQLALDPD